jgi:membrane fusion protein (multidrug efflux system)
MMVVPDHDIWVTANVKETSLDRVQVGDLVRFTVDGYGDTPFTGRVVSVAPATGAKFALLPPDNATGNFTKVVQNVPVRIAVDEPRDPDHPLRPGMSVDVAIATSS